MKKQVFNIRTPVHKQGIKWLACRSYKSLASTVINSKESLNATIKQLELKIRREMKQLFSASHDSILMEAVKRFHWDTILLEYKRMVPTLVLLLECLIPKPADRKTFVCFMASLLIKCCHQRMCLLQCAVSIMLYGNGSSKQVRIYFI